VSGSTSPDTVYFNFITKTPFISRIITIMECLSYCIAKSIDLSRNGILEIKPNAFFGLNKLNELNLIGLKT
jgi:hypothetical protein